MRAGASRIKVAAMLAASGVPGLSPAAVEVHMHLVDICPLSTMRCYPSLATLAERVGRTERTVHSALKKLAAKQVIKIEKRGGRNGTNLYRLLLLERKILELRPEESGRSDQKKPSDKPEKEQEKELGQASRTEVTQRTTSKQGREEVLSIDFEWVTESDHLEAWHKVISDLNFGRTMHIMNLLKGEKGYRLPSKVPGRDSESWEAQRKFFGLVIKSQGRCFG